MSYQDEGYEMDPKVDSEYQHQMRKLEQQIARYKSERTKMNAI